MRHFRVSTYSEEAELAPSWVAGVAREGNNKRTASTEATGGTIEGSQDAKTEILAYIFAPGDITRFLGQYAMVNKDEIRKNRNGAAEHLGFVDRVMHGSNPRTWLRELKSRIGEGAKRMVELE